MLVLVKLLLLEMDTRILLIGLKLFSLNSIQTLSYRVAAITQIRYRYYLSIVCVLVLLAVGSNTAFSQGDAQRIVNNLSSGNQDNAQLYMDRLSMLDANKIQCRLLINFGYVFDYDNKLFTRANMEWLLDSFVEKGYSWPSSCEYLERTYESHCLIYGGDLSSNQANLLKEIFEGLGKCSTINLGCTDANNQYKNAEYTDIYLYVVERYFSEALIDNSRSNCGEINSWAEAVVFTHTEYFKLGWAVYSDLQLESGSTSLQKSLDAMQSFVGINEDDLKEEYESLLQNMSDTDSAGARAKYNMLIETLAPYVDN